MFAAATYSSGSRCLVLTRGSNYQVSISIKSPVRRSFGAARRSPLNHTPQPAHSAIMHFHAPEELPIWHPAHARLCNYTRRVSAVHGRRQFGRSSTSLEDCCTMLAPQRILALERGGRVAWMSTRLSACRGMVAVLYIASMLMTALSITQRCRGCPKREALRTSHLADDTSSRRNQECVCTNIGAVAQHHDQPCSRLGLREDHTARPCT